MRVELRKSGEETATCPSCGSYDLLATEDLPLVHDFSDLLEKECLRREIRLAQVFREQMDRLAGEWVEREATLFREKEALLAELHSTMGSMVEWDTPRWRLFRKKREALFAKRVQTALWDLLNRTRYPIQSVNDKDRS